MAKLGVLVICALALCVAVAQDRTRSLEPSNKPSDALDNQYIETSKNIFRSFRQLKDDPNWTFVQRDDVTGINIYSQNRTFGGQEKVVFKMEVTTDYPPEMYFIAVVAKMEEMPSWNPVVKEAKNIRIIDSKTRLVFQKMKPQAVLDLDPRRFFVVFRNENTFINGAPGYAIAFASVDSKGQPGLPREPNPRAEWGHIDISGIQASKSATSSKTELTWILAIDFNFPTLPTDVVNLYAQFNMILYTENLLNHIDGVCSKRSDKCKKP